VSIQSHSVPLWNEGARLGIAFYRLIQALELGRVVENPLATRSQRNVTIGDLRDDFERAIGKKISLNASDLRRVSLFRLRTGESPLLIRRGDLAYAGSLMRGRWEQVVSRGRKLGDSDRTYMTGVVQQAAVGGARSMIETTGTRDKSVVGWIRVSGSGHPCSFCAMLLSRGFAYSDKGSAVRADIGGYHPHCKCYARPRFSTTDLLDDRYSLNRKMWSQWEWLKKDSGRNISISDWRKYYYRQYGR
jgi:hypothetical protein